MRSRRGFALMATTLAISVLACDLVETALGGRGTVRGSGNVVEETREVSGVTGVNLATDGDLIIEVGSTESLRIEAEDNLMEYIETQVRGGTLRIGTQRNVELRNTRPVTYYLTVTGLDAIEISSSGNIEAPDLEAERFSITIGSSGNLEMGDLEAGAVTVKISSSGNVTMGDLNADTLEVDIGSTGNLDIAGGQVRTQNVTIGSSGNYTAQDLVSDEADVRISSSGNATIRVNDRLKANLSGNGNLRYLGSPALDESTSSSGEVIQIGE